MLEETVRNGYRINVGLHIPMSDRVGAGEKRTNAANPHFVTQTERQKVGDCRADGWTSEGGKCTYYFRTAEVGGTPRWSA